MSEREIFLGIDLGTQSVKCLFCELIQIVTNTESGTEREEEEAEEDQIKQNSKVTKTIGKIIRVGQSRPLEVDRLHEGYAEQNPSDWIIALKEAIQNALQDDLDSDQIRNSIRAIGVSGQQHGLVLVDDIGEIVRPCMLWCDTRASEEAAQITSFTGRYIPPGFTAPKIMWLLKHEPENFEKTSKILLPHDYLNHYLSNQLVFSMECGDASGTGLMDTSTRQWDKASLDYIHPNLVQKLPPNLVGSQTIIGHVHERIAQELGLSYHGDYGSIILSPGCGDNAMTMLGISSIDGSATAASHLVISLGTSGTVMFTSPHPIIDPTGGVALFADATDRWLSLVCLQNCSMVPEEIVSTFASTLPSNSDQRNSLRTHLISLAEDDSSPGCEGITLLPYFSGGERTPNWPEATGCLIGLRHGHLQRPGLLYRSALEGVTYSLFRGFDRLKSAFSRQQEREQEGFEEILIHPLKCDEICLVGGGGKNTLWRQIISDIFGLPVRSPPTEVTDNAAALGAAVQAIAVTLQIPFDLVKISINSETETNSVLPVRELSEEMKREYEKGYQRHVRLSNALFEP